MYSCKTCNIKCEYIGKYEVKNKFIYKVKKVKFMRPSQYRCEHMCKSIKTIRCCRAKICMSLQQCLTW